MLVLTNNYTYIWRLDGRKYNIDVLYQIYFDNHCFRLYVFIVKQV